jgi:hypothetical protein
LGFQGRRDEIWSFTGFFGMIMTRLMVFTTMIMDRHGKPALNGAARGKRRNNMNMDAPEFRDVKIQEWLSEGFELYKKNLGLLILSGLVVSLLSAVTFGILAGPMFAGIALIALRLYDHDVIRPSVGDVFKGFGFFINTLLFFIIWGVILTAVMALLNLVPLVGQLLSLLAAWSAQALLMFSIFLIVDRDMGFWTASMASIDMVRTNFWPFLGLGLLAGIIGSIGAILCGIGVILTMPIQVCILTVAYRRVFGPSGLGLSY